MHRNVIFRNDHVPSPIIGFEQPTPHGLWTRARRRLPRSRHGCDVLAIPHNSNESNGHMFFVEYPGVAPPTSERRARRAARAMEPLVEIYQHKGDSECFNGLSGIVGAPDELCELREVATRSVRGLRRRHRPRRHRRLGCCRCRDFVRGALLDGLQEQERLGVNPYRLGIIASTDTHNGTPGACDEGRFMGHRGLDDDTPAVQLGRGGLDAGRPRVQPRRAGRRVGRGELAPGIFDALRRREVFGTSGTRLAVRFFGGWQLPDGPVRRPRSRRRRPTRTACRWAARSASATVGERPRVRGLGAARSGHGRSPGRAAAARCKIIKGWIDNGERTSRSTTWPATPDNGASVDTTTCTPHGAGADALCAVWRDPAFDPAQHAFYYVRVLENPTCRWNTYVCNALPAAEQPPACSDSTVNRDHPGARLDLADLVHAGPLALDGNSDLSD